MNCLCHFFLPALFVSSLSACTQQKKAIDNVFAYYKVTKPGALAMDENGRPRNAVFDTTYTIYIETSGPTPQWEFAWSSNKIYKIYYQELKNDTVQVGYSKPTRQKITLSVGKNKRLWMLNFSPTDEGKIAPEILRQGEILIQGTFQKRKTVQRIGSKTELLSLPVQ